MTRRLPHSLRSTARAVCARGLALAMCALPWAADARDLALGGGPDGGASSPGGGAADAGSPAQAGAGFDFMTLLAQHDLHELQPERWNAYGQLTAISSWKLPFAAGYTNLNGSKNSLSPDAEWSFTGTVTAYLGLALWRGAEAYLVPEIISERPLSGLTGLGGAIQNFELQKTGSEAPSLYRSRLYLSQTINLGGEPVTRPSRAMQLGTTVGSRRVVVTIGNFSILDLIDKNSYAGDLRRQFFNMAFLTHAAYDFAADARGYAWGGVAELYFDDWAVRIGRITPPQHPNQLEIDFRILDFYGDQLELEHTHRLFGRPGAVRLLGYRNRENMGRFDDATAAFRADATKNATTCAGFNYGSGNASAPDLCWARRPNVKLGLGVNLEQQLLDGVGVFARGMVSDGGTEVYSYTATDRSLSLGVLASGATWHRPADLAGIALGVGWISESHAAYLEAGGIDGFIGDGQLRQAPESVLELFYSLQLVRSIWLSADYQHISNPAFNADRGPVDLFGAKVHVEF